MQDRKYNIEREKEHIRKRKRPKSPGAHLKRAMEKYRSVNSPKREEGSCGQAFFRSRLLAQGTAALCLLALVMGMRLLPFEGTRKLTDELRAVATAELDADSIGEVLGELEFVSRIVPESVLVFWNRTGAEPEAVELPFLDGQVALQSEDGAWVVGSGVAHAAADGRVASVTRSQMGGYKVVIEHGGGLNSVYEPLVGVRAAPGDSLRKGESFAVPVEEDGICKLFFRLEKGETAVELDGYLAQ